jgi:hypothetical protein
VNYYGIVRPELQMRSNLQNLQQQVTANRFAAAGDTSAEQGLPLTGHTASFMNLGGYFMNMGAAGGGGGISGAAAPPNAGGGMRGAANRPATVARPSIPRR